MSFSLVFSNLGSSTIFSSSSFRPRIPSSSPSSTGRIFHTRKPKPLIKKLETLDARDTVIGFGKHKGKMLGTLPSSYLKWVSKNLRSGDSEYWAKLADEVLDDPVYQDRVEWEFAEKILHGSHESMRNVVSVKNKLGDGTSVSMLLEISERFGWDNEDKVGWSKVDLELLGTSKSGRIPRSTNNYENKEEITYNTRNEIEGRASKTGLEDGVYGGKRRERRERMRLRDDGKTGIREQRKGISEISRGTKGQPEIYNPFPGRESLLRKVLNRRKLQ